MNSVQWQCVLMAHCDVPPFVQVADVAHCVNMFYFANNYIKRCLRLFKYLLVSALHKILYRVKPSLRESGMFFAIHLDGIQ
jgi:hypothetical protein